MERNWSLWHRVKGWGTADSQTERQAEAIVTLLSPPPRTTEPDRSWEPYLRLHQPGLYCFPCTGIYPRLRLTQLRGCLQPHTSSYTAPGPALVATRFGSQFGSAWEPPSPEQLVAICRLLCSSHWVAPGGTQVVADSDLRCFGNPRACAPSRQLQTTLEHHHPAPV